MKGRMESGETDNMEEDLKKDANTWQKLDGKIQDMGVEKLALECQREVTEVRENAADRLRDQNWCPTFPR